MEATITQSGALYLVQHSRIKQRAKFFAQMRSAAREHHGPKRTEDSLPPQPPGHLDNGR